MAKKNNKSKRRPQGPIKFNVQLTQEQKKAKKLILENDIIVIFGKAGSGKTLISCQAALDALWGQRSIETIQIARPTVSKEDIGFLPGGIEDKLNPWLQPIYHNFYQCYNKQKIDELIANNIIEIRPLSYMRGITFCDSYVIIDECQNITIEQMKMIVTRLGKESTLIFCGDNAQIDLKNNQNSGLAYLLKAGEKIKGFASIELKENHRNPIVNEFLDEFEKMDNTNK